MPKKNARTLAIAKTAREHFGFESLRPGQQEAITALLDGHDTLVVQPTGSGKSAIYQIAGTLLDGATVIVSPLIAFRSTRWMRSRAKTHRPPSPSIPLRA
jgi:ATP-dependent DNA helicase RecQ